MTVLYESSCDALTDASLSILAEWALQLTHLNLEWCYHFTDQGVRRVIQRCTNLQFLKLEGCKQVTEKVLSLPELQAGRSEPWSPSRRNAAAAAAAAVDDDDDDDDDHDHDDGDDDDDADLTASASVPAVAAAAAAAGPRSASPLTLPQRPATELRLLNLTYVNNVEDEAILAFSAAFPNCTVVNYYGDEILGGVTSENPGTDCGGWDGPAAGGEGDEGGGAPEEVLFDAGGGFV
jgi:hypothetical protein